MALITGITGQDGSYLAELLLKKGYEVAGTVRKTSNMDYDNIGHIQDELNSFRQIFWIQFRFRESIQKVKPDEVYNLASQSHPAESFKQPFILQKLQRLEPTGYLMQFGMSFLMPKFYQAESRNVWLGKGDSSK